MAGCLCKWAEFSQPTSVGPTTLGWWPIMAEQGQRARPMAALASA
jgi:hypothetical protein